MDTRPATTDVDLLIVGAGFAGMAMPHRARVCGFTARLFEAGSDVTSLVVDALHMPTYIQNGFVQIWPPTALPGPFGVTGWRMCVMGSLGKPNA